MQFSSAGIVWVTARNDRTPTGTARTGSQESIIKKQSLSCQTINIRRFYSFIAVTSKIVPAHIIAYDKYHIGLFVRVCLFTIAGQRHNQKQK
jgi:hypothetical protein